MLHSWGNYPPVAQAVSACHWRDALPDRLQRLRAEADTTLAYGAGRSYGDSCLAASGRILHTRPLDRFIAADWSAGTLLAEAGATLGEILALAIPRGWFLPVTPGTQFVTLGGAIANDVHGKNHHRRGTFGRHVTRLGLVRSDRGRVECSTAAEAELFEATVGGLGLTGVIEWAEIRLVPIASSQLDVETHRFGDLDEFFAISAAHDERHEFSVSWIDCTARGPHTGRGIYAASDFAPEGALEVAPASRLAVPVRPPFSLVNRVSVRAFNAVHWRSAPAAWRRERSRYDKVFYPLDAIRQWNRVYGARGFQQYQCVIPERDARAAVGAILEAIARSHAGSFLAVLKRCGDLPSPGLLSFPMPGTTLALDFPQSGEPQADLFPRLDAIVRAAGGRLYPAKDAHMSGADFRQGYPAWARLEAARDPVLMSRFWQRVLA